MSTNTMPLKPTAKNKRQISKFSNQPKQPSRLLESKTRLRIVKSMKASHIRGGHSYH